MTWLHDRGVKGFLTFNVIKLIVQDVGLCGLARDLVPGLVLHGSTQMSITSAAGVAQAAALGCQRVILASELFLAELERLCVQLQQRHPAMPLKVFVHGAVCCVFQSVLNKLIVGSAQCQSTRVCPSVPAPLRINRRWPTPPAMRPALFAVSSRSLCLGFTASA